MEVDFKCVCGCRVSEFTRGGTSKSTSTECPDCEAVWTVTITNIRPGDTEA